ncbi:MAG: hypothetical protein QOJ68_1117 [Blastococcus sp.]|nr:hypothetical protein [Blastococcus sp.]
MSVVGVLITAAALVTATYPMVARERSAVFFVGWTALGLVGLSLRGGEARVWATATMARRLRKQVRALAALLDRRGVPRLPVPIRVRPAIATPRRLLPLALWVSRCRAHRGPPQALLAR